MNPQKISLIIPPLLCTILLSIVANLNTGKEISLFLEKLLSPVTVPINFLNHYTQSKISYLKNIPQLDRQLREQKVFIAHLLWQNETLKTAVKNEKNTNTLQNKYQKIVSVEVIGTSGKYLATTTQNIDEIQPGMPIVTGNILLGFVTEKISKNTLRIISLNDYQVPPINTHTASGQRGVYKYLEASPQIVNVPSQTPLILGDFVLTEATEIIPANLLVGKIVEILTDPQDPLQKGRIDLYYTLDNSPDNIAVILKP